MSAFTQFTSNKSVRIVWFFYLCFVTLVDSTCNITIPLDHIIFFELIQLPAATVRYAFSSYSFLPHKVSKKREENFQNPSEFEPWSPGAKKSNTMLHTPQRWLPYDEALENITGTPTNFDIVARCITWKLRGVHTNSKVYFRKISSLGSLHFLRTFDRVGCRTSRMGSRIFVGFHTISEYLPIKSVKSGI